MVLIPSSVSQFAEGVVEQAQHHGIRMHMTDFELRFARAIEQFSGRFGENEDGAPQHSAALSQNAIAAAPAHLPFADSVDFDFRHGVETPFSFDYFF